VKQCAVLFVNPVGQDSTHPATLRSLGFLVDDVAEWPCGDGAIRNYHVAIVHVRETAAAPMLAARLRAKPHFGRRLLIALVPAGSPAAERRSAEARGFDDVVNDCCDTRHLATRILRGLRARPELQCVLPPSLTRKPAA
jgi:hypothetical protein